jgi:hypothetical protein
VHIVCIVCFLSCVGRTKFAFQAAGMAPPPPVQPSSEADEFAATLQCPGVPDVVNPVSDYNTNFFDYRPEAEVPFAAGQPFELTDLRLLTGPWRGIAHLAGQVDKAAFDSSEHLQVGAAPQQLCLMW